MIVVVSSIPSLSTDGALTELLRRSRLTVCAAVIATALPVISGHPGGHAVESARGDSRSSEVREAQFSARVSRVRVAAIVTNATGEFVEDLAADEFTVYDDGVAQEIASLRLIDLSAGTYMNVGVRRDVSPGAGREGATVSAPQGLDMWEASWLGAIVFIIDGPSLSQDVRSRFADAWISLLDDMEFLPLPHAVYVVNSVGRVEEFMPLSNDLTALRRAARALREEPLFGTSLQSRLFEVARDLSNTGSFANAAEARQVASAKVRSFEAAERARSLDTLEVLTLFAEALRHTPGRSALVWVSTGIKVMQDGPFSKLLNSSASDSPDARLAGAQRSLHQAANATNVTIYAIDPSLLTSTRNTARDVLVRSGDTARLLSRPALERSLDGLRDAMRMAAAATGGEAHIQATDIHDVLVSIQRDWSRYYLITFEPRHRRGDGSYHEIRTDVSRESVNVRSRRGYVEGSSSNRKD